MSLSHPGKKNPAYRHGHATRKNGHSSTYISWYAI